MIKCDHCNAEIKIEEKIRKICLKCFEKIKNEKKIEKRQLIQKWLKEESITFSEIQESKKIFHFILDKIGPLNMRIEMYQEKNNPDITIGFMTFLSKDLTFKIYRFTEQQKEDFKRKVDEFISSLRVDYRTGIRVGYEIISERGHYGAKYFIKTNENVFDKKEFLRIFERVKKTGESSNEFLNQNLGNGF